MSHYSPIPELEPVDSPRGEVYVLHLSPPLGHARHYIGFAIDARRRIAEHLAGSGRAGKLPAAALAAGSSLEVAAVVPGSRWYERWLKNRGSAARVCPICTGRPLPTPRGQERGSWAP